MAEDGERVPLCPFCGEPVRDRKTAVFTPDEQKPAHFDCVLQDLAKHEPLAPGEKITYLGKGTFGVVSYRSGTAGIPFAIRKRIPYEQPAPRPPRESEAQRGPQSPGPQ